MPDVNYGSVNFPEQIAFFRRKLNLATQSWTDIVHAEHDHAFVVAGANRDDLVADFRDAIHKAIEQGGTLEDFRKDFDRIVEKYGWEYNGGRNWRSRVIYETNMRTSYAAGRYAQLQAVKATRPYWRYKHSDAVVHPRPQHLAWNNLVIHADNTWWKTHYPPNGWGCQCYVESLSARDLKRLGKDGPDEAPPLDTQQVTIGSRGPNPRVVDTPAGVDPGWGYAPGRDAYEQQLVQRALSSTTRLPAPQAAASAAETLSLDSVTESLAENYQAWLQQLQDAGQSSGSTLFVGALDPNLVAQLYARGIQPQTAAILIRDIDALHALREAKNQATASGKPRGLTGEELAALPNVLADPQAVLLDEGSQTLLFVSSAARRDARKEIVKINYKLRGGDVANVVRTSTLIDWADVAKDVKAGVLVLLRGEL